MSDLRVTNLKGRNPGEAPTLPDGVVITGITTVSSVIVGTGITLSSSGINVSGIITASSFSGNGSGLTGVAATTLTIGAGTTALPSISPTGDSNTGIFFPSADTIAFSEGGAEAMRVDSSGRLLIGTSTANANGGILQLTSGITFPATAVAATDVNTLDDYEEGTWTPSVGGTATYHSQEGNYTKIGRTVSIRCFIRINVLGTGSSYKITGIPFASGDGVTSLHVGYFESLAVNVVFIAGYIVGSDIFATSATAATASATNQPAIFGNSAIIYFSGVYNV